MTPTKESRKLRVVLAEDHHVMRAALNTLLSREPDIEVVGEVADGATLLETIGHLNPDILIMDAKMPNHDPVRAAEALREQFPDVRILVLSAHPTPNYVIGLLKAGVSGYVLKDDARDALLQALRKVAEGVEWVSPRVAGILINSVMANGLSATAGLTDRELEVLSLMALGYRNDRIAEELVISEHTVRNHIHSIFHKLGVETRVEAVLFAISSDLVPLNVIKDTFTSWPSTPENK